MNRYGYPQGDLTALPPGPEPTLPADPYGPRTGAPVPPTDPEGDYPWDISPRLIPPRRLTLPGVGSVVEGVPLSEPAPQTPTAPAPQELRRGLDFAKSQHFVFTIPANQAAGADLALGPGYVPGPVSFKDFHCWRLLVDNPTPYTLWLPDATRYVPPGVFGYPVLCRPALAALRVQVAPGSAAIGAVSVPVVIMALDALADVGAPVTAAGITNLLGQGNNGAALQAESVWLNEGGTFAALRGAAAAGGNGSALDGAANAIAPGAVPLAATGNNAVASVTAAAVAGQTNRLMFLCFGFSAAPAAAVAATVSFGGVTWTFEIPTANPQFLVPIPDGGIAATAVNTAIVATLPASGTAGVIGYIAMAYLVG